MKTSTDPLTSDRTTDCPLFEVGARVRLHGIHKRAELNDQFGSITGWQPDAGRFSVALESGERVRVRPLNLVAAANEQTCTRAKQETKQSSATARCEADQSNATARTAVSADSTLFFQAGRFVQPAASGRVMCDAAELQLAQEEGCEVHRTWLPAGHWSVWSLEHDDPHITVTLVACKGREVEAQSSLSEVDERWDELAGLTITRIIHAVEAVVEPGLLGVATTVDGGVLKVLIPLPRERSTEDAAPRHSEENEWERSPTPLAKAVSADRLDWQESDGDEAWADSDGAWGQHHWPRGQHKTGRVDFQRPLFVRRSQSLDTHGARRRSRKQANARRRAMAASSESRRCMHGRPGAPPLWQAKRAMMAAAGA